MTFQSKCDFSCLIPDYLELTYYYRLSSFAGINLGNGEAQIYMSGAGHITINAANINLTNNNSILTLFDGNITTLTGNINNTTGVNGHGILNLAHDLGSSNIITGDIGNIGSLAAVNVLLGAALILQY
ncbi:MAG TPA: hypothetical protein LFW11_04470 [Rickettsia endosymbiont of Proechinophthirus fluctus]|uniref:hypothetical protein n=1 Tax=Rickettsia endosymbiont of Proechinophthirus fluctus TaxID=1462733 RepID=UPI001D91DA93|nr:hypothetical protein [Rickettsia endosymbiont of Proechinophthirus fluctus]HJD54588.1 hypothetical protein [Rickettsia endosymbiont of Proechinophthirus fluctus]